jgi:hypothetical protein
MTDTFEDISRVYHDHPAKVARDAALADAQALDAENRRVAARKRKASPTPSFLTIFIICAAAGLMLGWGIWG